MAEIARIQAVLAEIGDGVACRHYHEPGSDVSLDLLVRLGLIAPITRGIPACADHGCPTLGRCAFQSDFDGQKPGRSGRKFRRTPEGAAAAADPAVLDRVVRERLNDVPVLAWLDDGARTIFDLTARALQADLDRLEGEEAGSGYSRRELGGRLRLLASLGLITIDPDGMTVRPVQ